MKYRLITAVALTAGILGVIALNGGMAEAYQGDYSAVGPNHTPEREAAMEQVMTEVDYNAWKSLMTEDGRTPGVLRKIDTEAEFAKFAEAYKLGKAGKTEEANAIRAELGLGNGQGRGQGQGQRMGGGNGTGCQQ